MPSPQETAKQKSAEQKAERQAARDFNALSKELLAKPHPPELASDLDNLKKINTHQEKLAALKILETKIQGSSQKPQAVADDQAKSKAVPAQNSPAIAKEDQKFWEEQGKDVWAAGKSGNDQVEWEKSSQVAADDPVADQQDKVLSDDQKFWEEEGKKVWAQGKDPVEADKAEADKFSNKEQWVGMKEMEKREDPEKLKEDVATARKKWLEIEWKKRNAYQKVYNVFGRAFNKEKFDKRIEEEDADVAYYRQYYEAALFKYRDCLLNDARDNNVSNKELGEILLKFEVESKLNLNDVRREVKLENEAGKFVPMIKNRSQEIVGKYNALSLKKKLAIAVGLGIATGLTVGATGAVAGVAGSAIGGYRLFVATVSGTGVWAKMDTKRRKKNEKLAGENAQEFMKSIEGLSDDEKFAAVKKHTEGLIMGMDERLGQIKKENLKNVGWGLAAAGGGFALAKTIQFLGGHYFAGLQSDGVPDNYSGYEYNGTSIPEKYFGLGTGASGKSFWDQWLDSFYDQPPAKGTEEALEVVKKSAKAVKDAAAEKVTSLESVQEAAKVGKDAILERAVGESWSIDHDGASVIGTMIERLKESGMSPKEAIIQANKMAKDYAVERGFGDKGAYSLIHKGAKLIMSPDNKHLLGITGDDKLGWFKPGGGFEFEKNISRAGLKAVKEAIKEKIENFKVPDSVNEMLGGTDKLNKELFDNAISGRSISEAAGKIIENGAAGITDNATSEVAQNIINDVTDNAVSQAGQEIARETVDGAISQTGGTVSEVGTSSIPEALANAQENIVEAAKKAGKVAAAVGAGAATAGATFMAGKKMMERAERKKAEKNMPDDFDIRGMKTIKFISGRWGNDNWRRITYWNFDKVKADMPKRISNRINKVIEKYKEIIGDSAIPRPDEKMIQWAGRIVDESIKKNTEPIKF